MIRRPPRSTQGRSSAASDVYKRQSGNQTSGRVASSSAPVCRCIGIYPMVELRQTSTVPKGIEIREGEINPLPKTYGSENQVRTHVVPKLIETSKAKRALAAVNTGRQSRTGTQFFQIFDVRCSHHAAIVRHSLVVGERTITDPYQFSIESHIRICLLYTSPSPRDRG